MVNMHIYMLYVYIYMYVHIHISMYEDMETQKYTRFLLLFVVINIYISLNMKGRH